VNSLEDSGTASIKTAGVMIVKSITTYAIGSGQSPSAANRGAVACRIRRILLGTGQGLLGHSRSC